MLQLFPHFGFTLERGLATWRGDVQPSDRSSVYRVAITYRLQAAPHVRVLAPQLVDRGDGKPIPHRYSDGSLCLYYPKNRDWTSEMAIADTIVPWACEWLHYYELWHAIGDWLGGGEHPQSRKRRSERAA
jgi:hypothetical protein